MLERWRAKRQEWMVLGVIQSKDIMLTDIPVLFNTAAMYI